jgi:hypothetical protein
MEEDMKKTEDPTDEEIKVMKLSINKYKDIRKTLSRKAVTSFFKDYSNSARVQLLYHFFNANSGSCETSQTQLMGMLVFTDINQFSNFVFTLETFGILAEGKNKYGVVSYSIDRAELDKYFHAIKNKV